MPIKRKTLVDTKKAESIIEAGDPVEINSLIKETPSLNKEKKSLNSGNNTKKKKDQISSVNLQISESYHDILKKFAAEKNLKLYEVYNFMAEYFIDDLSRFENLINMKNSSVTLFNCSEGWEIACPLCGKDSVIKDPDGKKFAQLKKELQTDCPNCRNTLHITGIEM